MGFAANYMGGAGGPLAVLFVALFAAEVGKAVSKETKIDILVTPIVTVLAGIGLAALIAAPVGKAASAVGQAIMWATELQPFFMGILVSVIIGVALTLPISSAAICAALGLTGLAGGAAVAGCCAQMVGFAVMSFRENRWGGLVFAPCDGRVVVTECVQETEYLGREMMQISIFMSITNIHMNWVPVGGEVEYFKYHPGRFLVPWQTRHPFDLRGALDLLHDLHPGQKLTLID